MKIEIDTKHDTKEELKHLATMLHALAGVSNNSIVADSRFPDPRDERLKKKLSRKGIFDDNSSTLPTPQPSAPASGGLFSLFNDEPSTPSPEISTYGAPEPQPVAQPASSTGDMFSMFAEPSQSPSAHAESPSASSLLGETMSAESSPTLLDPLANTESETESVEGKSAQDIIDDDRIVPY